MAFYSTVAEFFIPGSQLIPGLLIHMIVLLAAIALSFYGIYTTAKYTVRLSKNVHLLRLAFALMAFIPVGDIFEHLVIYPGTEFWHHMHIFASMAAFYFFYRFVMLIDAPEAEDMEKSYVTLAVIIIASVAFTTLHDAFIEKNGSPVLFLAVYGALACISAVFAYNLFQMLNKMKKVETTFSIRAFLASMIPIISTSLFLVTGASLFAEFILDTKPELSSQPWMISLIAGVNVFYLLLAVSLAYFGYMAKQINAFYSPIDNFLKSKGKKGQLAPPSGMNARPRRLKK